MLHHEKPPENLIVREQESNNEAISHSVQPETDTELELRERLAYAGVRANRSLLGRVNRALGVVGDSLTNIDMVKEEYNLPSGVKAETALHLMAQALAELEPIGQLRIDKNKLGKASKGQYEFALQKLAEARQQKDRIAADYPDLGSELVKQAIEEIKTHSGEGPLVSSEAETNLLYAGSAEDTSRALQEIASWLGRQDLAVINNPQVQEIFDKLKGRVRELESSGQTLEESRQAA